MQITSRKARLNILERRERLQEYLYLAKAERQTEGYVTMLVHLDRAQEAITYGLKHLRTTEQALALAKVLYSMKSMKSVNKAYR